MTKKSPPASKAAAKTSSKKDPAVPKGSLVPPRSDVVFSEDERKRRTLFESAKKHHRPCEAELCYRGQLPPWDPGWLVILGARQNNLKSIDVPIPLSAMTVVTGVSGSGKSSLVEDILARELARVLNRAHTAPGAFDLIATSSRSGRRRPRTPPPTPGSSNRSAPSTPGFPNRNSAAGRPGASVSMSPEGGAKSAKGPAS